jgi:hypothetical protein
VQTLKEASGPESGRARQGPGWRIKVKGSWLDDKMALYLAKPLLLEKAAHFRERHKMTRETPSRLTSKLDG